MPDLMYFDTPVLSFKEKEGVISEVDVTEPKLLPFLLLKDPSAENLTKWRDKRKIPRRREGIEEVKKHHEEMFEQKNFASLSDPYWIKYRFEKWSRVNFFTRIYSPAIGDLVFKPYENVRRENQPDISPDLSTIGVLRKAWRQYDGNPASYLLKAGSVKYHHEPLSEVLASTILEKLDLIDFVPYDLAVEGIEMCSKCRNFVEPGEELISAADFYYNRKRFPKETVYEHLIEMCKESGIEHPGKFIDRMTFVDLLMGNTDRNLSNIGFLRNIKTGEIRPAPLYDNGTAFFGEDNIHHETKLHFEEEKDIYKKILKDANLSAIASDKSYEDIIRNYPGLDKERAEQVMEEMGETFHNFYIGKVKERKEEKEKGEVR